MLTIPYKGSFRIPMTNGDSCISDKTYQTLSGFEPGINSYKALCALFYFNALTKFLSQLFTQIVTMSLDVCVSFCNTDNRYVDTSVYVKDSQIVCKQQSFNCCNINYVELVITKPPVLVK